MRFEMHVSRRGFLQVSAFGGAMLAVARLRSAGAAPTAEMRVLTPRDAAILTAVAARITDTGDPAMPAFAGTDAIFTIDRSLLFLDEGTRSQVGIALKLVEYGPPLFDFRFSRFTELPPESQDASIAGWRDSRFETRRLVYRAMKNLALLGYYAQDGTWPGIHYLGPVMPRPRLGMPQ